MRWKPGRQNDLTEGNEGNEEEKEGSGVRNREERLAQARDFLGTGMSSVLKSSAEKVLPLENSAGRCLLCGQIALVFVREIDAGSINPKRILDSS